MKINFKLLIITLFFIISCNEADQKQDDNQSKSGIALTNIQLNSLDGTSFNLSQYKGKTVFLNFWATWCKPCLQEMPSIKNAIEIINNRDIVFLFASDETVDQIESFKSKNDYNFNYVKAGNMEELNIMALPTTFIFDKSGNLVFNEMGYRKWDEKENIDLILNILK